MTHLFFILDFFMRGLSRIEDNLIIYAQLSGTTNHQLFGPPQISQIGKERCTHAHECATF